MPLKEYGKMVFFNGKKYKVLQLKSMTQANQNDLKELLEYLLDGSYELVVVAMPKDTK